ncbi:MAG: hypothetical protein GXP55_26400 [Deltaproteobacteria bacterium]|nr:hypothetical protein [Deltaproteobacteria bacterium]
MDVLLVRSSVYALPAKKRVGAILYGGTCDMRLWPGPGPDADLREAWGGRAMAKALEAELDKAGGQLSLGQSLRVQPGRLHCDFLLWLALKAAEPGATRASAPAEELLRRSVIDALGFAAGRSVERVAFGALGEGPGEIERAERLALLVRAAAEYEERCFAERRPTVIDEVLICEPLGSVLRAAQAKVGRLARATDPAPAPSSASPRKRSSKASPVRTKKPPPKGLSPVEAAAGRAKAERYDMHRTYEAGDYFIHPRFGLGLVGETLDNRAMLVRFEDGSERKMVHAR